MSIEGPSQNSQLQQTPARQRKIILSPYPKVSITWSNIFKIVVIVVVVIHRIYITTLFSLSKSVGVVFFKSFTEVVSRRVEFSAQKQAFQSFHHHQSKPLLIKKAGAESNASKDSKEKILGTKHAHGSDLASGQPFPWISTKEIRITGQPRSVFKRETRSHWACGPRHRPGLPYGEAAQSTTGSRLAVGGSLPCFPPPFFA